MLEAKLIKSIQCAQFVENLDTIKIIVGIDPKHVKTIPIWVLKGTNIIYLKVKQIWVPKGTIINSFGSPQNYFSKYSATNNHGPIKTNRSQKSSIM